MPDACQDAAGGVNALVARRWQEIDPLLPPPGALPAGCGTELIAAGASGQPEAVGSCEHWRGAPESLDLTWGAARRFRLTARVAGPDVATALHELLSRWRDHLAQVPGTADEDTAAVVTWPSRDIDGVAVLLRHGFAPLGVVAGRTAGRPGPQGAVPAGAGTFGASPAGASPAGEGMSGEGMSGEGASAEAARPGARIRRAGLADTDVVVRLGLATIRFDAHFGGVIERPGAADALRREAAGWLAGPEPWTWLAERDGAAIGMLTAERPEAAGWIASMTGLAPVAYLPLMVVLPGERGGGVGAALADRAHREIGAAGVAVTLLHYEQTNPLSAPFWGRQGYRPLWTSWEARPASTIR